MSFKVTVMYPNKLDTVFNMEHYLSKHMPLAEKIWGPLGLLKWELVEVVAGVDGKQSTFSVVNILTWNDGASYSAALKADDAARIFEDLPLVCNHEPIFVAGNVVARE
jgi:uncharacterized protein (TIGR02118 family)